MKINYINNQEEILNLINDEIKDEALKSHITSAVEYNFYEANEYQILKQIGQYGVWVKLKNGKLYHALFVNINLFNGSPIIIINTTNNTNELKEQLQTTYLPWVEEGLTWWKDKPLE